MSAVPLGSFRYEGLAHPEHELTPGRTILLIGIYVFPDHFGRRHLPAPLVIVRNKIYSYTGDIRITWASLTAERQ